MNMAILTSAMVYQHGNSERCNDWFRCISLAVGCMEGLQ